MKPIRPQSLFLAFAFCAYSSCGVHAQEPTPPEQPNLETIDTQRIDISDLNQRLREEMGMNVDEGREWLEERAKKLLSISGEKAGDKTSVFGVENSYGQTVELELSQNRGVLVSGNDLIVVAPLDELRQVQNMVETFEKFGIRQIVIRTLVVRDTTEAIKRLGIHWSHIEASPQHSPSSGISVQAVSFDQSSPKTVAAFYLDSMKKLENRDLPPPEGVTSATWTEATSVVERTTPVLYTLLTPSEYQTVVDNAKKNTTLQRLMSPTVVVFNGQIASVNDCVERPFVTGIKPVKLTDGNSQQVEFSPSIKVVPEGTTMNVRPELFDGKRIRLNCQLDLCKVRSVETLELPGIDGRGKFSIQLPEISSTRFRTCLDMPLNYALAVSAFETDEQGLKHSVVILCQCSLRDVETK